MPNKAHRFFYYIVSDDDWFYGGIDMRVAEYGQIEDRETEHGRTVYNSYVIDDGWNLPYEVIEEINLRIAHSQEEAYRDICRQNRQHKGDWLTKEVAYKYAAKSWVYRVIYCNQYIREVREISEELQKKYGVTELEAINILSGHNVSDYVHKYYRIKNLIPLRVDQQEICNRVIEEYRLAI